MFFWTSEGSCFSSALLHLPSYSIWDFDDSEFGDIQSICGALQEVRVFTKGIIRAFNT